MSEVRVQGVRSFVCRVVVYSTNNTRNSVTVAGWDGQEAQSTGVVLPNSAHLVAVGTCRNARYVAEAQIVYPAYPYALASTGEVTATGELKVEGVDRLADADDGVSDDERKEGHVVSNSTDSAAITLTPQAEVSGDVKAMGGIQQNGAQVEGEVSPGQTNPADLPKMELVRPSSSDPATDKTIYISDYDFESNPALQDDRNLKLTIAEAQADAGGDGGDLDISEMRVKVDTNGGVLELNQGLELSDGALFVDGDVVIRGGITGTGAITATGKITVHGASSLVGDEVALVSGGGVNIDGQGLGISKFKGLVATLGDFEADSTSIVGAYLAAGVDPVTQVGNSTMTLRDVHATHAQDATSMDIVIHVELKEVLDVGLGSIGDNQVGLLHNGAFYIFTGDPGLSEAEKAAQRQGTYQALLGVQGEVHPMAAGEVVVRTAGGGYQDIENSGLSFADKQSARVQRNNWNEYTTKLPAGIVTEIEIFKIDLNKFTSGSSRIKILTYR